jgi:hypothetical protein
MELFRPVGLAELRLIYEADMRAFPPRLPEQPIFYPVLSRSYARQIAADWNARSDEQAGYVTRFVVEPSYIAAFETKQVGAAEHRELWVPAEKLSTFNRHVQGPISIADAYFGKHFRGEVPTAFLLQDKEARRQVVALAELLDFNGMDFILELRTNHIAVFLNFPFWVLSEDFDGLSPARRQRVLEAIRSQWPTDRPPLPTFSRLAA